MDNDDYDPVYNRMDGYNVWFGEGEEPKGGITVNIRWWYPVWLVRWLTARAIRRDRL